MSVTSLLAFWGVSALFIITPGADWAYAISAGIHRGVRPAVLGLLSGHALATFVVAGGVGAVLAQIPGALLTLTITGSLYLVWLGVGALRATAFTPESSSAVASSAGGWWVRGFGVSGLNPKLFLLFFAVLPPFTDPNADWPLALQIAVFGAVHIASCAVVYHLIGYGAGRLLGERPGAARMVSRLSGAAMIAIGMLLIFEMVFGR